MDVMIRDWIRHHAVRRSGDDPLFATWERIDSLVRENPDEGWRVCLALVAAAPDDFVLANVAAGPLEDLINEFPDQLIDRIEEEARRDPKFRRCLTGVWGVPDGVGARIAKLTATAVDRL